VIHIQEAVIRGLISLEMGAIGQRTIHLARIWVPLQVLLMVEHPLKAS
jgi:hypothetical protein